MSSYSLLGPPPVICTAVPDVRFPTAPISHQYGSFHNFWRDLGYLSYICAIAEGDCAAAAVVVVMFCNTATVNSTSVVAAVVVLVVCH